MLLSMTGFGRHEINAGERKLSVEIKTINHRYLDLYVKMPKKLGLFEADVRNVLKQHINRGKVELYVGYEDYGTNSLSVKYNKDVAAEYLRHLKELCADFNLEDDICAHALSRYPDVFLLEEQSTDEAELLAILTQATLAAVEKLLLERKREGAHIQKDILEKLDVMRANLGLIMERAPQIVIHHQQKLTEKIKLMLDEAQMDEARILTEVAIFADKSCLDEEIVRLSSHIEAMTQALLGGGTVGRKLDFLAQEMNREANTIMSKANDLEVTNAAIELKTDIEKIREQVQNIE